MFHNLIRNIYIWLLGVAGGLFAIGEVYRRLGHAGALNTEAWFIHGVSETVHQLSQQRRAVVDGAVRLQTNVKGKTYPFNLIGSQDMAQITTNDAQTQYANPPQSKRRCHLYDFGLAVLIDDFDELKTLTDPASELSQIMGFSLERKKDDLVLSQTTAQVGGLLGTAEVVNEGAETATATTFATDSGSVTGTNTIAAGGAGLTMAKVRQSKRIMDTNNVVQEDQYFFYSPKGMEQLLSDPTATSSDYSTINALNSGGFPMDATWYGAKWRMSTKLWLSTNDRSCVRVQRLGVGMALGLVQEVQMGKDPGHWNNDFAMIKLSGGSVRIDPTCVIQVIIDESV